MTDKQHLSKAKSMPIKFLKASGKGFFIDKEGYVLAIRDDLKEVIGNEAFKKHRKVTNVLNLISSFESKEKYEKRVIQVRNFGLPINII